MGVSIFKHILVIFALLSLSLATSRRHEEATSLDDLVDGIQTLELSLDEKRSSLLEEKLLAETIYAEKQLKALDELCSKSPLATNKLLRLFLTKLPHALLYNRWARGHTWSQLFDKDAFSADHYFGFDLTFDLAAALLSTVAEEYTQLARDNLLSAVDYQFLVVAGFGNVALSLYLDMGVEKKHPIELVDLVRLTYPSMEDGFLEHVVDQVETLMVLQIATQREEKIVFHERATKNVGPTYSHFLPLCFSPKLAFMLAAAEMYAYFESYIRYLEAKELHSLSRELHEDLSIPGKVFKQCKGILKARLSQVK